MSCALILSILLPMIRSMKAISITAALALLGANAALAQAPSPDPAKPEVFSRGIGSNQFGMTLDQIDAIQHYQKVRWTNLPIAREYLPVEVHYFVHAGPNKASLCSFSRRTRGCFASPFVSRPLARHLNACRTSRVLLE